VVDRAINHFVLGEIFETTITSTQEFLIMGDKSLRLEIKFSRYSIASNCELLSYYNYIASMFFSKILSHSLFIFICSKMIVNSCIFLYIIFLIKEVFWKSGNKK
jgi:hypothetical protein